MKKFLDLISKIIAVPSFVLMMFGGAVQNPLILFSGFIAFLVCALIQLTFIEEW